MIRTSRGVRALLAGLSLAVATTAWAGPPTVPAAPPRPPPPAAPIASTVQVRVMVVRATKRHTRVDPALTPYLKHLSMLQFTGFELVSDNTERLGIEDSAQFGLEGGRKVCIDLRGFDETQAKIRVRMFEPRSENTTLDTTISIHRNRAFFVGGPRVEGTEDVLILPIQVSY